LTFYFINQPKLSIMKRVLLLLLLFIACLYHPKVWAQCNSVTPVIFWPLQQHPAGLTPIPYAPDNSPIAPISIDGNVSDWQQYLLGAFSGDNNNPYTPYAFSGANWSQDGINGVDDRDGPTAPRDLNFFAFTYDTKNTFFYFRRINNGNSQNAYYYFCDIMSANNTVFGPDGYMNNGEPVFRVKYTNGGGANLEVEVLRYVVNTTAAGYVAGKGNPMVSPTTEFADGYPLSGSVVSVTIPTTSTGEIFAAKETESGYGVEFAIPWSFLKNYTTNSSPIPQGNIFTYHVSLLNGSDNINNAQDNAGGCCAGVASSGNAEVTPGSLTVPGNTHSSNTYYKTRLALTESAGATTNVSVSKVSFKNLTPGTLPASVDPTSFIVKVSIDDNGDNAPDAGTTQTYEYNSLTSGEYIYVPFSAPVTKLLEVSGSAYFIIEVEMKNPGIKTYDFTIYYSKEIANTNASLCSPENIASTSEHVENITTPLPVSFKAFAAMRHQQTVSLKWETASEQNNRGFNVQRNTKGVWENIAFVFSAADGGNSSELLSYSFKDANSEKGVSQYRIQQVDMDGKASYSVIRSVNGLGQATRTIVYPNPSADGKVNVVFEDQSAKAVVVSDMSGRVVRQYNGVVNNLQVEGLESGMYSIQVTDLSSAETSVEKVLIKKR
jgi:hypothetical protein